MPVYIGSSYWQLKNSCTGLKYVQKTIFCIHLRCSLPNVPTPQAIVYLWGNGYIEGLCFSDIHVFNYITLVVQLWDWYIANYSTGFQDIIIYFEIQDICFPG